MSHSIGRQVVRRIRACTNAIRSRAGAIATGGFVVAVAVVVASCNPERGLSPAAKAVSLHSAFDITPSTDEGNPGQCLLPDVNDAAFLNNPQLNCTSQDVDIAVANVTFYRFHAGDPLIPLNPGDKIQCTPGQTVLVTTSAQIQNNANQRYDLGLWIGINGVNALDGTGGDGKCNHYHLVDGQGNALNLDSPSDACADVQSSTNVDIPLGELAIQCTDDPNLQGQQVTISACAGWLNNAAPGGGRDGICPVPGLALAQGYRYGTTPENAAKCKCNPLTLPIDIRGKITIIKNTTGGDGTFGFTHDVGTNSNPQVATPFSLTTVSGTKTQVIDLVSAGTYHVTESAPPAGWEFVDASCTTGGSVSSQTATIILNPGDEVTCTFNNRKKPTLTVNKVCAPTTDGGKFNLQIDGATAGTGGDALCGGTTGSQIESVGPHTVGETQGTGTLLSNYNTPVIGGDCAADGSITLAAGDNKTCTITNTRKPHLTVNKICSPTTDGGKFNLRIDGATVGTGADALCGGTTGSQLETIGPHSVSETQGTGTLLSNYATPVIGGDCAADGSITLVAGQNAVCTITNTRKGTLRVNKVCLPTTDGGKFNLQIDGATAGTGSDALCGGTTGAVQVSFGPHTVGETQGTGTLLSNYNTPVIGGDCAADGSVSIAAGDAKVCTITNTRKPHLTVNKVCVPTTDGGKFNLQIDGATAGTGADALCGGTTGSQLETIGPHSVGETQGTGTLLSNYNTPVIGGDCAADGSITLVAGQNAVCSITNTRKPHLTVNKVCVPTTDGGKFNLQIDGATVGTGADALCGGTTGSQLETIGPHSVGETQGTGTLLSDYNTPAIGGDCAADGSITLAAGANKVCTITNTRKPKVKVVKSLNPTTDAGKFDLTLAGTLFNDGGPGYGDGGNTGFQFVAIGTVSMSEAGHTGTSLGSYTSSLACVNASNAAVTVSPNNKTSGSISVAAGDVITCTFTNTRRASVTLNKRENGVLPLIHTWSFEIRSGASTSAAGTVEATGTANTTTGVVNFACSPEDANCTNVSGIAQLLPGTYQVCETGMPVGYHNNITGFTPLGAVVEGQDNSTECIGITLGIGGSGVPTGIPDPIDNVQPPGGDARTIGYWKNWSSCTGGNQFTKATAPGGVGIGRTLDGYLPSSPAVLAIGNILSLTCPQAVNLLGKSDINTGKNMASDAAYGLAAQLFAAELNVAAGAAHSACADAAIANGSTLLKAINFLGTGSYLGKVSGPAQTALKNNALLYASQLDHYNNNTLPCP